ISIKAYSHWQRQFALVGDRVFKARIGLTGVRLDGRGARFPAPRPAYGGTAFSYDATVHAVTLGFILSMIFGHAPAPAFRDLGNRVDLDDVTRRLREGLTSGHPDMPTFRFTREDARALTAYLRSIQAH